MSADLFLILLITSTIITISLTEALKRLLAAAEVPYRTNAVVLDSAMIASTFTGVLYRLPFGLGFAPVQLMRLLLLILFTWFVSMWVYDKIVQTVRQYKRYKEIKENNEIEEEKRNVEELCIKTISQHSSMGESGGGESS